MSRGNVHVLPGGYIDQETGGREEDFIVGIGVGLSDAYRCMCALDALKQTGLSLEAFKRAGACSYDLETLEEMFSQMGDL